MVNGHPIPTDVEGYLKNLDDWSEDFARAQAAAEGLVPVSYTHLTLPTSDLV